jgi:hypothetical protein
MRDESKDAGWAAAVGATGKPPFYRAHKRELLLLGGIILLVIIVVAVLPSPGGSGGQSQYQLWYGRGYQSGQTVAAQVGWMATGDGVTRSEYCSQLGAGSSGSGGAYGYAASTKAQKNAWVAGCAAALSSH